jgi:hypothetical protein
MEEQLRLNLMQCADTYALAKGMKLSTLARLAAGDWRFFTSVKSGDKTFTARKYDEVMQWFSDHWPADLAWPSEVDRPSISAPSLAPEGEAVAAPDGVQS